jgi:spore coat protein U-like protein
MTFEAAESVTLKIWDRSTMHHTLDALVEDLSTRHNTTKGSIAVTCSGPNTFTLTLNSGAA